MHLLGSALVAVMHWCVPETGRGTRIWRSTRNPVRSASRGGTGRSRAPGCPGGAAGSHRSPGPSSFLALCRPPAPAALKSSPVLVTYFNPLVQHGLRTARWCVVRSNFRRQSLVSYKPEDYCSEQVNRCQLLQNCWAAFYFTHNSFHATKPAQNSSTKLINWN